MADIVRVGYVSAVNYKDGTVQVTYKDRDNSVSPYMPLWSNEWNPPDIDTMVYVVHLQNGGTRGLVLIPPYTEGNRPVEGKPNIWRKEFGDGNYIRYDKKTKVLDVVTDTVNMKDVNISGNLSVTGEIKAGTIKTSGNVSIGGNLSVAGIIS